MDPAHRKLWGAAACLALFCAGPLVGPAKDGKPATAPEQSPRTDAFGDPLPPGAVARLGTLRLWHGGQVASVGISPDGKVVASGGGWAQRRTGLRTGQGTTDGRVCLWDAAAGTRLRVLQAPNRVVTCLSFSPDGKLLAGGCFPGDIYLWDTNTGKLLRRLPTGNNAAVTGVAFSTNGRRLLSAALGLNNGPQVPDSTEVASWDVSSGQQLGLRKAAGGPATGNKGDGKRWEVVRNLAVSPDGKVLLKHFQIITAEPKGGHVYSSEGILRAYDTAGGGLLYQLKDKVSNGQAPAFSGNGKCFAWGGSPLLLVEAATGRVLRKVENQFTYAGGLALSPDGKRLAALGSNGQLRLWDLAAAKQIAEPVRGINDLDALRSHGVHVGSCQVAFSAGGRLVAAADGGAVRLFDAVTGEERPELPGHRAGVTLLRFRTAGALTSVGPRTIRHWDVASEKAAMRLGRVRLGPQGAFLAVSPDGSAVVCRAGNDALELRDSVSGKVLRTLQGPHRPDYGSAPFSQDGKRLAVIMSAGGQELAAVYDTATGREVNEVPLPGGGNTAHVMRLNFGYQAGLSPDGKLLAWAEAGGRTQLLEVATGKVLSRLGKHRKAGIADAEVCPYHLAFSPDGRLLATAFTTAQEVFGASVEEPAVCVWDVPSGRKLLRLPFRREGGAPALLTDLAFSPDGRTLAIGSHADDRVRLIEVASGQERRALPSGQYAVLSLAFSADGRTLATGGEDGTILLWDLAGTGRRGAEKLSASRLEALWADLASADAAQADRAIRALTRSPAETVPFLRGRLRPAASVEAPRVKRLLADLQSERFAVRDRATRELEKIGEPAEAALTAALAKTASLEARRRITRLLEGIRAPTPPLPRLRELRALEVLEHVGTPAARGILRALAGGEPSRRQTREASASLRRLEARGGR